METHERTQPVEPLILTVREKKFILDADLAEACGAMMAASARNSPNAVERSVFAVKAFVRVRERLAANPETLKRMAEIEKTLLEHNDALRVIWNQFLPLLAPFDPLQKGHIGFDAHDM